MNAGSKKRYDTIINVCSNNDFKSALNKIEVKTNELQTIFKLCYGCYDNDDIRWILDSLSLDKEVIGETESGIIKSLLALDQVLDIDGDAKRNWKAAEKKLAIAEPLLEAKMMNLDKDLVFLSSFLLHGDFTLILKMHEQPQYKFLFPKSAEVLPEYQEFLMGLCGTISHRVQPISINTLFRQYYKNLQKGISTNDSDYMKPNSSRSYAIFCLYKSLDISPIWSFLYLGDINVWTYVWELYYDNMNYQDPFLNPMIILMIILNYIETPTAFKEILYDNEYLRNYCKFLRDPAFQEIKVLPQKKSDSSTKLEHDPQIIEDSWKGYCSKGQGITELLWANWSKGKDKLEEMAKTHFFSQILEFWPNKKQNFTDKSIAEGLKQAALMSIRKKYNKVENKEIDDFCKRAMKTSQSLEIFINNPENAQVQSKIIDELENIFPEIIKNVINSVSEILEDPRDIESEEEEKGGANKPKNEKKKDPYEIPRIQKHFEDRNGNEFTMCALASIVEIRNAYFNLNDLDDRGEDHYKLFTYKLDVLLTMIEKNNFHKNFMNSFSKFRVMQMVGLAAGFCIRGEHMIRANVTTQFNDYEFQRGYSKILENFKNTPKKLNFLVMVEKLKRIWEILKDFKNARSERYFRIYNLGSLETAIENESYDEINMEPENILYQSYPGQTSFKWMPFIYDVMTCNSLMDYNENFYFDNSSSIKMAESRMNWLKQLGATEKDLRSDILWEDVLKYQNIWNSYFENENFLLLIGILRGNYVGLMESSTYFTNNCSGIVNYLYGLLGLNASANFIDEDNVSVCESYITAIAGQLSSKPKALNEILKFLYGHAETIKKFNTSFGDNEQIFDKFMMLSASTLLSIPDLSSAEFLISKITGLTALEIEIFKKILEVALGITNHLDDLIIASKKKKGLTENSAKALSNLICNLDIYSLLTEANMTPEFFNLRDKTTYSINMDKNTFQFQLELFKIAIFQFPETVSDTVSLKNITNCDMFGDKREEEDRTCKQLENRKKRDRLSLLFQVISGVLDGDFSIFFHLTTDDFLDVLKVLNLANSKIDLKTLKVIASLKPNKLDPKLVKNEGSRS